MSGRGHWTSRRARASVNDAIAGPGFAPHAWRGRRRRRDRRRNVRAPRARRAHRSPARLHPERDRLRRADRDGSADGRGIHRFFPNKRALARPASFVLCASPIRRESTLARAPTRVDRRGAIARSRDRASTRVRRLRDRANGRARASSSSPAFVSGAFVPGSDRPGGRDSADESSRSLRRRRALGRAHVAFLRHRAARRRLARDATWEPKSAQMRRTRAARVDR